MLGVQVPPEEPLSSSRQAPQRWISPGGLVSFGRLRIESAAADGCALKSAAEAKALPQGLHLNRSEEQEMVRSASSKPWRLLVVTLAMSLSAWQTMAEGSRRFPNIVLITIDTLRLDRLSVYGYERQTSPNIDALLARGSRFDQARVPEPLTSPSICSMLTSLYPHQHGSSRNALRLRSGLTSVTTPLRRRGYRSAAFVGNWTLRDELTGLAEHFDHYQEIFSRKRWLVIRGEADAEDITRETLEWVGEHTAKEQKFPFLVWAHYVEPHAPYRLHKAHLKDLGLKGKELSSSDRYDTEIAFVDRAVGDLLAGLAKVSPANDTLVIFLSDHGESLGEHSYWGHGRNLFEETLHVPMGIAWQGKIESQVLSAPASSLDLAPTILGLLGLAVPESFEGYDWSAVLLGKGQAPEDRITYFQAHRGAALGDGRHARRRGLLEVGLLHLGRKETLRAKGGDPHIVDLAKDPKERRNLAESGQEPSPELVEWLRAVREGLEKADELPAPVIDDEDREKLKALGYID